MKKYIFSLFILCFSFLFLAGCNSAQTSQSPIQLQATIAIEPEYDNITVLGKFIIAEKDNQSAIYSYNGTTYQLPSENTLLRNLLLIIRLTIRYQSILKNLIQQITMKMEK